MQPLIRNKGIIKSGKMIVYDKTLYAYTMEAYEGKNVDILIEETKEEISKDQHGYYRGGVLPTAAQSEQFGGWTTQEIHAYFVGKYLSTVVIRKLNDKEHEVRIAQSTANIGKRKMAKFIDAVIIDLSEMGIEVLDSDDYNLKLNKTREYGK